MLLPFACSRQLEIRPALGSEVTGAAFVSEKPPGHRRTALKGEFHASRPAFFLRLHKSF